MLTATAHRTSGTRAAPPAPVHPIPPASALATLLRVIKEFVSSEGSGRDTNPLITAAARAGVRAGAETVKARP